MASSHRNNKTLFHQTANKIKRFLAFYKLKYCLETLSKDCTSTFLMVIQYPCFIYVAHKCFIFTSQHYVEKGGLHGKCSITRISLWYYLIKAQTFFVQGSASIFLPFVKNKGLQKIQERLDWVCYQIHHSLLLQMRYLVSQRVVSEVTLKLYKKWPLKRF